MADMTYADVQARATELGITPVIGKNRKFLEAAIAEAEATLPVGTEAPADGSMSEPIEGDPDGIAGELIEEDTPAPPIVEAVTGKGGEVAEPVGSAGRVVHWNCSAGDLDGGTEAAINQHIADIHA